MLTLLLALTGASVLAPALIRVMGRPAFGILALVPAAGFAWLVSLFTRGTLAPGARPITYEYAWMPTANLNISLRLDALSGIFGLVILGIGALVLLYCWGYFDGNPKRLSAFGSELVAFAMAMYGLVISDSLLMMFVFWEITSVLSFLLVGYYGERASSRRAAGQALMVTTLGGLAMLVGIILMGVTTGSWKLSDVASHATTLTATPAMTVAVVLILAGALSKSAIAPTHFWLPGAMAAPTPVSAYLHSAAMVKAGIYLVARLSPDFAEIPSWHLVVLPLGLGTMIMAGWMALRQRDLKLILAYGTVSQLGFILTVVGIGSREALRAGLALMLAHALFKATLFMVVGAIDHCAGTRDTRELSGLGRRYPLVAALATLAAMSMAGIPPLFGFVAKESALEAVLHEQLLVGMPGRMTLVGMVVGSILTMAYSLYFLHGAFATKPGYAGQPEQDERSPQAGMSEAVRTMHRIGTTLWLSPAVLGLAGVVFGLLPQPLDALLETHLAETFPGQPAASHLALWHGLGLPLLLTAVIVCVGAIMHWQRALVANAQFEQPALGSADAAYDAVLDALRRISLRLTASTQRGSLPINMSVILGTMVLLPIGALIAGGRNDIRMEMWDGPVQGLVAIIVTIAAVAATVMRNRLSAVIFVGITGYGIAMIFAMHGAPDLALTQLLVETLSMVVFVLVLRRLPAQTTPGFGDHPRIRAWLSIAVGLTVAVLGAFAMNARRTLPISEFIPALAKEIGHGSNAVNVLLVDIRAWDTLGEVTVLVIVATGVASLVFRTRNFSRISTRPRLCENASWLATTSESERARNRSLMVEVGTRFLFPAIITLSIYFFFAGHNAPGGGFAGGLVASLAFTLRYLAGGREELEAALPIDAGRVLGTGLALSAAMAIGPMLLGLPPLTSHVIDLELPLIGPVHAVTGLIFDAGVYLIVVGLVLQILRSLGGQLDKDEELRKQRARDRARRMARAKKQRLAQAKEK